MCKPDHVCHTHEINLAWSALHHKKVKNYGKDCWGGCNKKQGACKWCGDGVCCRHGWGDKKNGCNGHHGIKGKGHVCAPKTGAKGNHVTNHAQFGGTAINANSLVGKKVTHSVPADGCKALKTPKNQKNWYKGKVVLIKRGTCYFVDKVRLCSRCSNQPLRRI